MTKEGVLKYLKPQGSFLHDCFVKAIENGDVQNLYEISKQYPDQIKDVVIQTFDNNPEWSEEFYKKGYAAYSCRLLPYALSRQYVDDHKENEKKVFDIVNALLELGADPCQGDMSDDTSYDNNGFTPLVDAIRKDYISVVELLLKKKASMLTRDDGNGLYIIPESLEKINLDESNSENQVQKQWIGAINLALSHSNKEMVEYLLEKRASIIAGSKSDVGNSSEYEEESVGDEEESVGDEEESVGDEEESVGDEDDVITTQKLLFEALEEAIMHSSKEMVELLLQNGATLLGCDSWGDRTPLELAVDLNNIELIDLLIKKGFDPNQPDEYGWTPAMRATVKENKEVLKKLLEYNEDFKERLEKGAKPMTIGIKLVKDCLSHQDSENIKLELKLDDLYNLATQGHFDLVRILCEYNQFSAYNMRQAIEKSSKEENYPILMGLIAAQGGYIKNEKSVAVNHMESRYCDEVYEKLLKNFTHIVDELLREDPSQRPLPDPLISLSATLSIFASFFSDSRISKASLSILSHSSKNFLSSIKKLLNVELIKNLKNIDHVVDGVTVSEKYYLMKLVDEKFTELEGRINTALANPSIEVPEEIVSTISLLHKEIRGEENKYEIYKNTGVSLVHSIREHFPYAYFMHEETKDISGPTKRILECLGLEDGFFLKVAIAKNPPEDFYQPEYKKLRMGEPEVKKQNCSSQGYSDSSQVFEVDVEQGGAYNLVEGQSNVSSVMGECVKPPCTEEC